MNEPIDYVSVCAGIEAATVAWHPLGWRPVLFSEIEAFPRAVLAHHYPDVPLHGDFTTLIDNPPMARLLAGGTPCQAFSVAGKRLSLDDYRGNLSLAFADLAHAIDADRGGVEDVVWENVTGVLSTRDNAFGCFLGRLVGADAPLLPNHRGGRWSRAGVVSGPKRTAAWRVLDAQYFGVAQRRERVIVLSSRGPRNWSCAAALFPVGEGLSRYPAPRRETREGVARPATSGAGTGSRSLAPRDTVDALTSSGRGVERPGESRGQDPIVLTVQDISPALTARDHKSVKPEADGACVVLSVTGEVTHALKAEGADGSEDGTGRGVPIIAALVGRAEFAEDREPTLRASGGDVGGGSEALVVGAAYHPRRLTPRECERLQGFPDDYTLVPYGRPSKKKLDDDFLKYQLRGNPKHLTRDDVQRLAADGPRYRALGNSWAVPMMRWVGQRIEFVRPFFTPQTFGSPTPSADLQAHGATRDGVVDAVRDPQTPSGMNAE